MEQDNRLEDLEAFSAALAGRDYARVLRDLVEEVSRFHGATTSEFYRESAGPSLPQDEIHALLSEFKQQKQSAAFEQRVAQNAEQDRLKVAESLSGFPVTAAQLVEAAKAHPGLYETDPANAILRTFGKEYRTFLTGTTTETPVILPASATGIGGSVEPSTGTADERVEAAYQYAVNHA